MQTNRLLADITNRVPVKDANGGKGEGKGKRLESKDKKDQKPKNRENKEIFEGDALDELLKGRKVAVGSKKMDYSS